MTDESRTSISTPVLASHARFGEGVPHRIVVAFHRPRSHPSRAGARFSVGLRSRPRTGERRASRRSCRLACGDRMPRDLASSRARVTVLFGSRCYAILNSVGCTADKSSTRSTEARTEPRMPTAGAGRSPGRLSFGHHRLGFHGGRETHPQLNIGSTRANRHAPHTHALRSIWTRSRKRLWVSRSVSGAQTEQS